MRKTVLDLVRERSRLVKVPVIVGSLVIAAGVLATYLFSDYLARIATTDFQTQTNDQTALFARTVENRTSEFEQILAMLATYRRLYPQADVQQWNEFIRQSSIVERNPYIVGIGYLDVLPASELPQYIETVKKEIPNFTYFSRQQGSIVAPVRYIEPATPGNLSTVGADLYSEPARQQAMERARDEANASMTTPVRLLQDEVKNSDLYASIIYFPVYDGGIPTSLEDRRARVKGYTFAAFRPNDLVENIRTSKGAYLERSSYAVMDDSSGLTVTNRAFSPQSRVATYDDTETANVIDKKWTISVTSYQTAFQRWTTPGVTFLLGIATSFALGGAVIYLMTKRLVRLDAIHQNEIQRTKDELLALTSHQLRTPASGVKQYVGMLLQGFVGDLTPEQEIIAKKAFAANERQLETINQLLHVAKADADQLVLQPEQVDLTELTHQVVDSMNNSISEHESEVVFKNPKKPIMVSVDERYMRMVIENLISNALKYSEVGRAIKITLASRKDVALLSVRDFGVGISEEDITKLFKKFARIPNPLSKTVGGSGLGLFLSEQIMLAHGGDIEVDSKLGKGSIFTLTLPIDEDNHERKDKE